jgi:colicin import membrane protein
MPILIKHLCLLCIALVLPLGAAEAQDRKQLAEQRERIEASHAEALKACAQRFAVNACEDQAKRERAAALKPLREREHVLAAEERQARSQAQRERMQSKQQASAIEDGRRQQRTVLSEIAAASAPVAASAAPKLSNVDAQAHGRAVQAQIAQGEREAVQRRQRAAMRLQQAEGHRESVQRREDERETKARTSKKTVTPLPVPSAAEIRALPAVAASAAKP